MEPLATLDPSAPPDSLSLDYVGLDVHKHETTYALTPAAFRTPRAARG